MGIGKIDGQMDFLGLIEEYKDNQGATVRVKNPVNKKIKEKRTGEPRQMVLDFTDVSGDSEVKCEEIKEEPVEEVIEEVKEEPVEEVIEEVKEEPAPVKTTPAAGKELLFKQCKRCWCNDCRHNKLNEGVPRNFCGTMMACPACDECIKDGSATICAIGDYETGCELRGIEEGLFKPYSEDDI